MVRVHLQSCSVFQFVGLYTIVGFVVFFLVSCETVVTRKSEKKTPATIDPDLTKAADDFMNQQAQAVLDLADQTLKRVVPQVPEPVERRMALLMLDGVFHDLYAPYRPPVQAFLRSRIAAAADRIENTRVTEGAIIWKLYNQAFVVRTPTLTLAFDLCRNIDWSPYRDAVDFSIPNDVMSRIVNQCDVLFISHRDPDHADYWIAQQFLDQGKPVVATEDTWSDKPIHSRITHLERRLHARRPVRIQNGRVTLEVATYPGHQVKTPNNFYVIYTPDGISFSHNGDQANDEDFNWIDQIGDHQQVDVFLANCTAIQRMLDGVDADIIITGHENELGHRIEVRIPNWHVYELQEESTYPLVLMAWGEEFHYLPEAGPAG